MFCDLYHFFYFVLLGIYSVHLNRFSSTILFIYIKQSLISSAIKRKMLHKRSHIPEAVSPYLVKCFVVIDIPYALLHSGTMAIRPKRPHCYRHALRAHMLEYHQICDTRRIMTLVQAHRRNLSPINHCPHHIYVTFIFRSF